MILIYLILSAFSGVLFPIAARAQEGAPALESAALDTQAAEQQVQDREALIKSAVREYFGEQKKRKTERDELISKIVLNVAKGVAIIIALLVLRAIIKAIGRGVEEEGTEGPFSVFITTASEEEAATIGRTLVEEHLAVSSNITPQIRSIYRWQDKIEDEPEFLMIVRTTQEHIPDIISRVSELHSYDVPDIIALPIRRINDPHRDWIVETPRKKKWWRRS